MKSLRDFLWEECLQHLDLGENGPYDEMGELESDICRAVEKWLRQVKDNHRYDTYEEAFPKERLFDELIKLTDVPKNPTEGAESQ